MHALALTVAFAIVIFLTVYGLFRLAWAIITRPWALVYVLATLVLGLCLTRADAATFELSVVVESSDDRAAADEAVSAAAAIYRTQLGVELVATVHEVSSVAGHTKAEALLDALKQYRLDRPALRATDATVLFTRRDMTRGYEGIATIGPSCTAAASLIVRLRNDGLDGEMLAHEVAHTVGVPHDTMPGYLMSESVARTSAQNFSNDSVLTFKAAPADCMVDAKPAAAVSASAPSTSNGGGGAADWLMLVVLAILSVFIARERKGRDAAKVLTARIKTLEAQLAPEFALCDMIGAWARPFNDTERFLLVKFTTYACMVEFEQWLNTQRRRAQTDTFSGGNGQSEGSDAV